MATSASENGQAKNGSFTITDEQRETLLAMVEDIAGEDVREVTIALLNAQGEITDEEIEAQLGVKLNQVRKALYKLYDTQLVSVRREKDKETGYFIYYWRIHPDRIDKILQEKRELVLKKLETRLQYEKENMFFHCGNKECPRVTFNVAFENDFICEKCGGKLEHFDNSKIITVLEQRIIELKDIMNS